MQGQITSTSTFHRPALCKNKIQTKTKSESGCAPHSATGNNLQKQLLPLHAQGTDNTHRSSRDDQSIHLIHRLDDPLDCRRLDLLITTRKDGTLCARKRTQNVLDGNAV